MFYLPCSKLWNSKLQYLIITLGLTCLLLSDKIRCTSHGLAEPITVVVYNVTYYPDGFKPVK